MASTSNSKPKVFAGKNSNAKPTKKMYAPVTLEAERAADAAATAASRRDASSASLAAAPFAGLTMILLPFFSVVITAFVVTPPSRPSITSATRGTPVARLVAPAAPDSLAGLARRTPPITTELGLKSSEKIFARWSPLEPATTSPRSEPHTNTSPPAITSEFWFTSPRTCVFMSGACQTDVAGEAKKNRVSRNASSRDEKMRNGPERRTSVARRARAWRAWGTRNARRDVR